jgi:predicted permease
MEEMWPIVASVLGVFLVMGMGAFARHRDWLTQQADRSLANLTANVLLPAYFIEKILFDAQYESAGLAWSPPVFGFVTTSLGFLLATAFARRLGPRVGLTSDGSQRAFGLCVGVCNYGFIPLPLAERFYPGAVVDLILHNVGVNLALWSVGIAVISGSLRNGWKQAILSPPFLSVLLAVLLRRGGLGQLIPTAIQSAIETLGHCAIPMGLLLSGAIIVDFLRAAKWNGTASMMLSAVLLRQGLFPMLMLGAAGAWAGSTSLQQVMMLQAAMPAAIFPIVIVRLYQHDIDTALRVVLSSSLSGIVLIPVWMAIGCWWLNL